MDPGDAADGGDLDRLSELCSELGGTVLDGDVLAWAGTGDIADVPDQVFGVVRDAGLLEYIDPRFDMPADAAALMDRMWELDEDAAIDLLTSLSASTSRQRQRRVRRRYQADPQEVFEEMARLTGPGTRWWTNTDLSTWNQITQHAFDAVLVGAGNGLIVTVIAFQGGG